MAEFLKHLVITSALANLMSKDTDLVDVIKNKLVAIEFLNSPIDDIHLLCSAIVNLAVLRTDQAFEGRTASSLVNKLLKTYRHLEEIHFRSVGQMNSVLVYKYDLEEHQPSLTYGIYVNKVKRGDVLTFQGLIAKLANSGF